MHEDLRRKLAERGAFTPDQLGAVADLRAAGVPEARVLALLAEHGGEVLPVLKEMLDAGKATRGAAHGAAPGPPAPEPTHKAAHEQPPVPPAPVAAHLPTAPHGSSRAGKTLPGHGRDAKP